jgi:hypothetical protein
MLVFLPDSKTFLTVADRQFPIECDARTGNELRRFKLPDDLVKKVSLQDLRLRDGGKTLETFGRTAGQVPSVRLRWDVAKGEVSGRAQADDRERFEEDFFGMRSPDGEWMAGGSVVRRADGTDKPTQVFDQTERALNASTSWSADSKRVALPRAVGKTPEERQKEESHSVVVFDMAKGERVVELAAGKVVRSAFTPDGTRLATMTKFKVAVWDLATGKEVFGAACDSGNTIIRRGLAFTPDASRLVTAHGTHCLVWDVTAAKGK